MPENCCTIIRPAQSTSGRLALGSMSRRAAEASPGQLAGRLPPGLPCGEGSIEASSWCSSAVSTSPPRQPRNLARVVRAASSRPRRRSQRGDSSREGRRRSSCSAAGGRTARRTSRHRSSEPRRGGRPSTCARSMPATAVRRKAEPSVPRRWAGEISPRYIGTTTVLPPHATPERTRERRRIRMAAMLRLVEHGSSSRPSAGEASAAEASAGKAEAAAPTSAATAYRPLLWRRKARRPQPSAR
mmetsp:Transcript_47737/g.154892  ORF Transcript_47737/g.154892 Transcript_47737/m.154892 type:complete len:243 (+) Transcript_47737:782-1510(+)